MSYTTLQAARVQATASAPNTDNTVDDAVLAGYLPVAAAMIDNYCGQRFVEYIETYGFDGEVGSQNPTLNLKGKPLLSIDTLLNGDGSTILAANYTLLPVGGTYPKRKVRLNMGSYWLGSGTIYGYGPVGPLNDEAYAEDAIQITGKWGFRRFYATQAWALSTRTVQGTGLTTSDTTLTLNAAPGLTAPLIDVGSILRIDSEYVRVTGPVASSTKTNGLNTTALTIVRAQNGSTAATHATSAAIYVWQPEPVIDTCAQMVVAWLYETRLDASAPQFQAPDMGSVQIAVDLPPRVKALLGYPYFNEHEGGG